MLLWQIRRFSLVILTWNPDLEPVPKLCESIWSVSCGHLDFSSSLWSHRLFLHLWSTSPPPLPPPCLGSPHHMSRYCPVAVSKTTNSPHPPQRKPISKLALVTMIILVFLQSFILWHKIDVIYTNMKSSSIRIRNFGTWINLENKLNDRVGW